MTIAIRPGTAADAAALSALYRRSFTDTFGHLYQPDDLAAFLASREPDCFTGALADGCRVLMAEDGGELAGFAMIGPPALPIAAEPGDAELRMLYLLKPWHGSGLAERLLTGAMDLARSGGAGTMRLSVYIDNHRARRFYARFGFTRVGSYAFMVGEQRDEDLIYETRL